MPYLLFVTTFANISTLHDWTIKVCVNGLYKFRLSKIYIGWIIHGEKGSIWENASKHLFALFYFHYITNRYVLIVSCQKTTCNTYFFIFGKIKLIEKYLSILIWSDYVCFRKFIIIWWYIWFTYCYALSFLGHCFNFGALCTAILLRVKLWESIINETASS